MISIILFASDLDNTLIHSYKKAAESDICVEYKEEKALSYMTPDALEMLRELNSRNDIIFAPLTTRSTEQYERINFFGEQFPELALAANGGILYENGRINDSWFKESRDIISDCYTEFEKGIDYFSDDEYVYFDIRIVDELFVFTKSSAPFTTKAVLDSVLDLSKVGAYNIGDKVYIFPNSLTKGAAVERLRKKYDFEKVICAGDSDFDVSMLNKADLALCPDNIRRFVSSGFCVSFDTEKRNFAEQMLEHIKNNF